MVVKHDPITNTKKVCDFYKKKDFVPIKYVCTTEIKGNNTPCDVFYRADGSGHPQFGNRYFAIFTDSRGTFITNADDVENYTFSCIADSNGDFHYSQYRHDFRAVDTGFVDGGRAYCRIGGSESGGFPVSKTFKVINGKFIEAQND